MKQRTFSPYEQTQLARYSVQSSQVSGNEPVEYATGKAGFCGLEFIVTPAVLIPRVETEGLVELSLQVFAEKLASMPEQLKLVEVGTGSGAVIISIAKHLENSTVPIQLYAGDISYEALEIARKNASLTTTPIDFKQSNLLDGFSDIHPDIIIANLPYIPSDRIKTLDESVKRYEPRLALDGGEDGFSLIGSVIKQSITLLKPGGTMILELDHTHAHSFFDTFLDQYSVQFFRDCFDQHRFARLDLKK